MEEKNHHNVTTIKIDLWSIIKITLIIAAIWILYLLRDVILIVLIAGLLAAIINPIVNYLERKKIPRLMGAVFIYLGVLLILILIGLAIVPAVGEQTRLFIDQIPNFLKTIFSKMEANIQLDSQSQFFEIIDKWLDKSSLSTLSVFSFLSTMAGQIISILMSFVLAFYLSVRKESVRSFIRSITPRKYQDFLDKFIESTQKEIGAWARGLLLLCLFVGTLAYLGLLILGVKFPLTLAVIAGLTEVIPYLGPWLGAIPAVLIALTQSPTLALFVLIFYIAIQQIENALISPYVMHRAVGLDPLAIILALLIGGKLAGPIGMILAVPAATMISILIKRYSKYRQKTLENQIE
ncbi:MAG: AI-2E family transporter [Patescibacteria group bacterium]|jgi:predicted PurR-regulated permease PerM|nr:AI-2E family transporter [Patescibacteria group bacterium]MDD5172608.1 AI-2E family transporter [Patescibacteria group bacterium]